MASDGPSADSRSLADATADSSERERLQARLDELVREHRFTIAVVFPLVGAVSLVASAEGWYPDPVVFLEFNPLFVLFGVLVMRLPLVAGVAPLVDRKAGVALALLTAYAYGIEYVGATTGWPYGAFEYTVPLGPMIADTIPVALPVFFFPLVLNAYLLTLLLLGDRADSTPIRLGATIAAVLATDLVLDPGAVAVRFWAYDCAATGTCGYYGVPWSNYAGWVLSATVAVLAFDRGLDRAGLGRRLRECEFMLDDLVSFVLLWGGINALYGNWIPVAIAAALGVGLLRTDRFDFAVGDSALLRAVRR
ncbi:carotenoid biosynthesis protein [Halorubellus sp. JP-L1]|uniref:bisanhydrobacterioruberin hydratase n=1 Tax=Halorubellus sp. JP-L1 TaxID=2715753 RepID=UPI00140B31E0|nr:bisanhydrobacterioruberin hydratase [Halorubellus sp. JP-L1]NHN41320.1 carotenoid biosynthesis protein [Halorubellus sp. JP-L1]